VPSRHDPADSLRHIIENAARVARYLKGLDQQSFARNDWARDAVERCIERVCEASVRLGDQADELMPGQPRSDIRGMGNRLRHAYDRVDVDLLWRTATNRLPELATRSTTGVGATRTATWLTMAISIVPPPRPSGGIS